MNVFWSLMKKEYRLTSDFFWGWLVVGLVSGGLGIYLAYRYTVGIELVLAVGAILLHVFYLPLYLFRSLSKEWRNTAHLWLQLPQSGWFLLAAKLASGTLAMLVTFALACSFTLWIAVVESAVFNFPWPVMIQYGSLTAIGVVLTSFYLGLWAILISVTMAVAKSFLRKRSRLVGFGVFLIPTWGLGIFRDTLIYQKLVLWGPIYLSLPYTQYHLAQYDLVGLQEPIYLGVLLFYALVMGAVFYLSGWLLDKKVEV